MAKKNSKFNFPGSPAATEIDEEMTSVKSQPSQSAAKPNLSRTRSSRSKNGGWILVQCRLPEDLNKRMVIYNAQNDVTKNDFIVEAVRTLLDKLGVKLRKN